MNPIRIQIRIGLQSGTAQSLHSEHLMSRLQLQSKLALWPQMSSAHLLDALISDTHLGGAFPPPFCLAISLFSDPLPPFLLLTIFSRVQCGALFSSDVVASVCLFIRMAWRRGRPSPLPLRPWLGAWYYHQPHFHCSGTVPLCCNYIRLFKIIILRRFSLFFSIFTAFVCSIELFGFPFFVFQFNYNNFIASTVGASNANSLRMEIRILRIINVLPMVLAYRISNS